jgi:hypothetical protein
MAPVLIYLMRSMSGAGRVIEEEWLVRCSLLLTIDIADGLIGDLIVSVAAIRTDVCLIFHQIRLVLIGLRTDKSLFSPDSPVRLSE